MRQSTCVIVIFERPGGTLTSVATIRGRLKQTELNLLFLPDDGGTFRVPPELVDHIAEFTTEQMEILGVEPAERGLTVNYPDMFPEPMDLSLLLARCVPVSEADVFDPPPRRHRLYRRIAWHPLVSGLFAAHSAWSLYASDATVFRVAGLCLTLFWFGLSLFDALTRHKFLNWLYSHD